MRIEKRLYLKGKQMHSRESRHQVETNIFLGMKPAFKKIKTIAYSHSIPNQDVISLHEGN